MRVLQYLRWTCWQPWTTPRTSTMLWLVSLSRETYAVLNERLVSLWACAVTQRAESYVGE